MNWNLDKGRPLSAQICETLCTAIVRGEFSPGDKVPSVRDIGTEAGVNPNTVQRAVEELERQGDIYSVRGSGRIVSEDISAARECVDRLCRVRTPEYFAAMEILGMSPEEVKEFIKEYTL